MSKVPEKGDHLIADINGHCPGGNSYPPGEKLYYIQKYTPKTEEYATAITVFVPDEEPVHCFYMYDNDIEWLEEEQIWVLKLGQKYQRRETE